ncbi:MAG: hypothetical protein H7244_07330 [Herminiimonas sp.]|nr:hypothetical protein [Herminiimonas sp.]
MTSLTINDLSNTAELDRKAMAAVRGGMYKGYTPPSFGGSKHDFSFDATQLTSQTQNNINENGNNVAFVDGINSTFKPTQTNTSTISF